MILLPPSETGECRRIVPTAGGTGMPTAMRRTGLMAAL